MNDLNAPSAARGLLRQVGVELDLCEQLRAQDDLLREGVGSAQMIELTLLIEDMIGVELSAEQVERLTTLADVEALLASRF